MLVFHDRFPPLIADVVGSIRVERRIEVDQVNALGRDALADAVLDKGDLDGYAAWKRRAVEELQKTRLGARIRVH